MWFSLTGALVPLLVSDAINFITNHINNGSKAPVTLYIAASAGEFIDGLRLYDFLKAIPNSVETVAYGYLDSTSLLAYLAGDKRIALPHALFDTYVGVFRMEPHEAPLSYHQGLLNMHKTIEEKMQQIIAEETGKTKKEIERVIHSENVFSAEQARDFGIVHLISDTLPVCAPPEPQEEPEEPVKN